MKNIFKTRILFLLCCIGLATYSLIKIPINLGLDLQGGTQIVLEASDTEDIKVDSNAISGIIAVIRNRVDGLGITEPIIQKKGERQVVVELAGIKDPERAVALLGDTALLEFVEASWAPSNIQNLDKEKIALLAGDNARVQTLKNYDRQGRLVSEQALLLKSTVLTGGDLKEANPGTGQYGDPLELIEFTGEGAKKFFDITRNNVGKPLAILLDGTVISAPNINEAISGGKAQISGNFSAQEVKDLVIKLKAGSLPVPVKVISNKIVGPTLGKDSIKKSEVAAIIGFILVIALIVFSYKRIGIIASVGLILFILFSLAILKLFGATLTLPGIAGLILTTGMAVDANIIIFERIREEFSEKTTNHSAIEKGFKRAFLTILDANVTTIIAASVLFAFGTGSIKGFAITLSIGVIVSMFTAIFVTKLLINIFEKNKLIKVN